MVEEESDEYFDRKVEKDDGYDSETEVMIHKNKKQYTERYLEEKKGKLRTTL